MRERKFTSGEEATVGRGNVFFDLGFEQGEAQALMVRSQLLMHLQRHIRKKRCTSVHVARRLHLREARAVALMKGNVNDFSVDVLVALAWRTGLRATIETVA